MQRAAERIKSCVRRRVHERQEGGRVCGRRYPLMPPVPITTRTALWADATRSSQN